MPSIVKPAGKASSTDKKRAVVLVATAVCMTVLIGFAALAIDLGYVQVVRAQLQTVADAAALAGASALVESGTLTDPVSQQSLAERARNLALEYGMKNHVIGQPFEVDPMDIVIGRIDDLKNLKEQLAPQVYPYNAVRVNAVMNESSPGGPAQLFFARIWGRQHAAVSASATAAVNNHVAGFKPHPTGGALLPVTVSIEKWNHDIVNGHGNDQFGYDSENGVILWSGDGIPEISIYPEKKKQCGSPDGAGSFGLLNIGNPNQGQPNVAAQIRHGVTAENLSREIGSEQIVFVSDNGSPITHQISGNPGLKASLESDFEARVGQIVGFFIHSEVSGSGANAQFTIVDIQFGRLMMVNLRGSPNNKVVVVQPTGYTGSDLVIHPAAPQHQTAGRIFLVR